MKTIALTILATTLMATYSVSATTTDFDYDGTTTTVTAVGDIPLVCGITSAIGVSEGDIQIALLEKGVSVPAVEDLYQLIVKSNSASPVTYDVAYDSTTLKIASTNTNAVAGTDAYFTIDGTNKLAESNSMIKTEDTYTANIYAVTDKTFSYYQKMIGANLVGTITVNCPDS